MAVRFISLALLVLLPLFQAAFTVSLDSPVEGAALQGLVAIEGNTQVDGFERYRLEFSAADDPAASWFLIVESLEPVRDGALAEWDTSALSDGDYALRLTVYITDVEPEVREAHGLRVRNYTTIETNTPAPTPTLSAGQTAVPTNTPQPPTATPLPGNPAAVSEAAWSRAVRWGILAGFVGLGLLGLYARSRR